MNATSFNVGNLVRGLVVITLSDRPGECAPGFQFIVDKINDDGTIVIRRDDGTIRQHIATVPAEQLEPAYVFYNGLHYSSRALPDVIRVLDDVRQRVVRIHVSRGYTETHIGHKPDSMKEIGEDWLEEFGSEGTIQRCTSGRIRCPLLLHNSRSLGGDLIDGDSIVKIRETKTRRVLYQHPKYRLPKLELYPVVDTDLKSKGYTHGVSADGKNVANFKNAKLAQRYVNKF